MIAKRQRVVEETDGVPEDEDEDDAAALMSLRNPSAEAIAKFEDYRG